MGNIIGERIKNLRKELKLTQSELAGNEMTKSMLSQIENGIAVPSMKNLQYLAGRLGKPISYFLDEDGVKEQENEKNIYTEEINRYITEAQNLNDDDKYEEAKIKIEELLQKHVFSHSSKIYADILKVYSEPLINLKDFKQGENIIKECVKIYINNNLYADAAKVYQNLIFQALMNFEYSKCLSILDEAYEIYLKSPIKDIMFEIENLYNRMGVYHSMGDMHKTLSIAQEAIDISRKTNIYYMTDEIYRMKALTYLILDKYDEFKYNIQKAIQFSEFTESKWSRISIELNLALYENEINNTDEALKHIEKYRELIGKDSNWYIHQKSISLYKLGDYKNAFEIITRYDYSVNRFSKVDYLFTWTLKIYEGLILHKLNKSQEGIKSISTGIEKLLIHSNSKYLSFAYKALSEVYEELGDFKAAFEASRKSIEIKEALIKDGQVYPY